MVAGELPLTPRRCDECPFETLHSADVSSGSQEKHSRSTTCKQRDKNSTDAGLRNDWLNMRCRNAFDPV